MIAHRCGGCTRLFYPTDDHPLRCDAVILSITDADIELAQKTAAARMEAAKGMKHAGGAYREDDELLKRELGARGEIIVSRLLGYEFDAKPFGLDVGPYNVRSRGRLDYEHLIRDGDVTHHPDVPYLLVTFEQTWRVGVVRGWMTPTEAARPEWRQGHGGYRNAFFVPQAELHDLRRLPERGYT